MLGGMGLIGGVVAVIIVVSDIAYHRDDMPEIATPPTTGPTNRQPPQRTWPEPPTVIMAYTHAYPPRRPLTTGEAHTAMQLHLDCTPRECGWKRAALRALVEAGRIVPDSHRSGL